MSEFMYLFRASEAGARAAMDTADAAQKSLQAWWAWIAELESRGHLKNRGQPLERSGRVVSAKGTVVTDGPFVEAKDMVLGFITVEARDMDEAELLSRGCPMLDGGSVEIRPIASL